MIARFFRYANKVFHLRPLTRDIEDGRVQPQITGPAVWFSMVVIFLLRLGSLNALEEMLRDPRRRTKWARFLGDVPPSADTLGYFAERVHCDSLRRVLHAIYTCLQRNHQTTHLRIGGWVALALDGHELFASYYRHCDHCRQRTVRTAQGERIQYYHTLVAAHLVGGPIPILLDVEEQRPGEDEIATALRLLNRVQIHYRKAYDVITGDAIYADPRIVSFLRSHKKHLIAVLKANHPDLLTDVNALCNQVSPTKEILGKNEYLRWDIDELSTWTTIQDKIRVIRSRETKPIHGQSTTSDWYWVTTFSGSEASTETICRIGHARWDIENDAFNYLSTHYHFDHPFRHHGNAILAFALTACIVYGLVSTFYTLNLKPPARNFCMTTLTRKFLLTLDLLLDSPRGPQSIRDPT